MDKNLLEGRHVTILGAGPTGLGAAWRLQELGFPDYCVYESALQAGGLAASYTDRAGFTWDIGGHVQFSHYRYFDSLMESLLAGEWLSHERDSHVWILGRLVPYPFQNNIQALPDPEMRECLVGLIRAARQSYDTRPANFGEWVDRLYGTGITKHFLRPYNFKVWAYEPEQLSCQWVGERVAPVDIERVVLNVLDRKSDAGWGPNNTFQFPVRGGTGEIWRRLAARLPKDKIRYGKTLTSVDTAARRLCFADGSAEEYDLLVSTIPVDSFVDMSDRFELREAAGKLIHSTTHVIGIGIEGAPPEHLQPRCWMYFPENSSPFYRATVFSNYSPNNVPDIKRFWSMMVEVSQSPVKPVDEAAVVEQSIAALVEQGMLESPGRVASRWHYVAPHGYPTPSLERDQALEVLLPALEALGIYSRGRFGAWKYEVSNQDHSLMQGVEIANRLFSGEPELTVNDPEAINQPGKR